MVIYGRVVLHDGVHLINDGVHLIKSAPRYILTLANLITSKVRPVFDLQSKKHDT